MVRVDQEDERTPKKLRLNPHPDSESNPFGEFLTKHGYHTRSKGSTNSSSSSSSVLTKSRSPPSKSSSLSKKLRFDGTPSSKNSETPRVSYIKELQTLIRTAIASGRFKRKCECGNFVQDCCGRTILEEISSISPSSL